MTPHFWARTVTATLAAAALGLPATASAAQPTLTDEGNRYRLVTDTDTAVADTVSVSGNSQFFDLLPSGGTAVAWNVQAATCAQDPQTFAVRCTGVPLPILIDARAGDDAVTGTASFQPLQFFGGPGNDSFVGSPGPDTADGGPGDDQLDGGPGADDLAGGPGTDTVSYADRTAGVTVTPDDSADDGQPGEGDDVHSDVENIIGGSGPDTITGAPGPSRLVGNAGDDVIQARDGAPDVIDCGPGNDRVVADASDTVIGCETVEIDDDRDGFLRGVDDCDDTRADVHPGAVDVPGNGIDENCDGVDAAAAAARPARARVVPAVVNYTFTSFATFAKVLKLSLTGAPAGSAISVRCTGRGKSCPYKTRSFVAAKATTNLATTPLKKAKLRQGTVLEVRVSAPGAIGRVVRLTVTKKNVKVATLCLAPGAAAPASCSAAR